MNKSTDNTNTQEPNANTKESFIQVALTIDLVFAQMDVSPNPEWDAFALRIESDLNELIAGNRYHTKIIVRRYSGNSLEDVKFFIVCDPKIPELMAVTKAVATTFNEFFADGKVDMSATDIDALNKTLQEELAKKMSENPEAFQLPENVRERLAVEIEALKNMPDELFVFE
jgi:hypothetical protein